MALTIRDRLYCILSSEATPLEQSQKLTSVCLVGISGTRELSWMVQKLGHLCIHSRFVSYNTQSDSEADVELVLTQVLWNSYITFKELVQCSCTTPGIQVVDHSLHVSYMAIR